MVKSHNVDMLLSVILRFLTRFMAIGALVLLLTSAVCADETQSAKATAAPFSYVQAKAFHIPPETTIEESEYFSLCEGRNGKIYIGTAAYGRNSYLVECDPRTEKMRIVRDTHKLVGLPLTPTGYAA